jgi:hypothetical protein
MVKVIKKERRNERVVWKKKGLGYVFSTPDLWKKKRTDPP